MSFKYETIPIEKRKEESQRLLGKYHDRVPVIVETDPKAGFPALEKNKYLAPKTITMGEFVYRIVRKMGIGPEKACFLFINRKLHSTSDTMAQIYATEKHEDGFLYCYLKSEDTFGAQI